MVRYTHDILKAKMLADPDIKREYDELNDEFELFREMLRIRLAAGKTQEDMAKKLHTTTSAISRLENSGGRKRHSPSLATLQKYANALGYHLKIQFIHNQNAA
jgi:transcriptional regulator with XRE-family HTH domain